MKKVQYAPIQTLKRDLDHALLALRELLHSRVVALMREVLDKRSDLVAVFVLEETVPSRGSREQ